uniref:Vacuolar protein sorting-associated protein 16 homolog n=1 Tax=Meloidogyne javanica TaxID=6303 RepID=A0A915MEA5_MELJA
MRFIRSINPEDMNIAVDQCLSVAAHHFDSKLQKQLLKAASIGMRRCQRPYDADKFVRICRLLRVLNALRLMGIPLTFTQLEELSPASIVDRLVVLGHWPMAVKLCEFLEINSKEGVYKVIAHWCLAMMTTFKEQNRDSESANAHKIAELAQHVAEMASRQGLPALAEILLDLETNSEIRDEAPDRLLALYEQSDDFIRQALLYLNKAEQSSADVFDSSKTTEFLFKAEKALKNMKETQTAQLIGENAQLIIENVKREEKFGTSLSHLSVRDTFIWAVEHDELAIMDQLRKQHRLVDKQVFLWTIEGFARAGKWQQLEQYARSRKSPIGFLSIIELCTKYGDKNLATRFMDKLTGYEEQVRAYLIMNEIKKAATLAAEKIDLTMLQLIRRRVPPSSQQWAEVTKIIENLGRTK